MQIIKEINFPTMSLALALTALGFLYLIVNLFEIEFELIQGWALTDLGYLVTPVLGIGFGITLSLMHRGRGNHGIAWIFFTTSIILFFTAEMAFDYDFEYNLNDISTFASDILWISGYAFLFAFLIFFLKPFKKSITKDMIIKISLFSFALVIPSIYILYDIYPILTGIMLIPTLIGALLFFKGEMNSLWFLMVFALLSELLGDHLYTWAVVSDEYYAGHFSDLFYQWGYVLYAFAVFYYLKLFRLESKVEKKLDDFEKG